MCDGHPIFSASGSRRMKRDDGVRLRSPDCTVVDTITSCRELARFASRLLLGGPCCAAYLSPHTQHTGKDVSVLRIATAHSPPLDCPGRYPRSVPCLIDSRWCTSGIVQRSTYLPQLRTGASDRCGHICQNFYMRINNPMMAPVSPGCHTKKNALLLACGLNHSAHAGESYMAAAWVTVAGAEPGI